MSHPTGGRMMSEQDDDQARAGLDMTTVPHQRRPVHEDPLFDSGDDPD